MNTLLYKLQITGYQNNAFLKIARNKTTGTVKNTNRIKRLRTVSILLCVICVGIPLLFLPHTIALANILLTPIEKGIKRKFLKRAKRKLCNMPDLVKIGITGSYGKTSVKNILKEMLSTEYKTVASPESFNTPMGFAKTVNECLKDDTQILIMEMGARQVGDIKEMCDLVNPQHGIITSIGECHIETFGNIENVIKGKEELFTALPPDAIAITDGDNLNCKKLFHPNKVEVLFGTENFETKLLGRHNQKNILMCVEMARRLSVSENNIKAAIAKLRPTPHRLELSVASNGIRILDDSYNSNPQSAKSALEVLSQFKKQRVVQTPGFVEQGANTQNAHIQFGKQISEVADAVIIVGKLNRENLSKGLLDYTGKVFYVDSREDAKKIYQKLLKAGDTLLIENDIPEQY